MAIDLVNHTGVLDRASCVELIESTPTGRVGFLVDGAPMVLPVNFAWTDDSADEQAVCFEVDRWDESTRSGWSVVVAGVARKVTEWAERELLEQIGLVPWARAAWRTMRVRIELNDISGRVLY